MAQPVRKQPFEEKDYLFDFSAELEREETITLISCKATNLASGADSTAEIIGDDPPPLLSGQALVFWIKNGNDGESHNINIRVETSRGQKLEGNLWISIVKEKPPPNLGA